MMGTMMFTAMIMKIYGGDYSNPNITINVNIMIISKTKIDMIRIWRQQWQYRRWQIHAVMANLTIFVVIKERLLTRTGVCIPCRQLCMGLRRQQQTKDSLLNFGVEWRRLVNQKKWRRKMTTKNFVMGRNVEQWSWSWLWDFGI